MLLLYNFAIRCYWISIRIASLFNEKAGKWFLGRKDNFSLLEKGLDLPHGPVIWMHCASLGEFEQGRPILEELRKQYPKHFLLLSFFSPSGYEIRKHYAEVNHVTYLPLDTSKNAKRFLDIVQPEMAIFIKYEFWYHFLTQLREQNIPTLLVSAIFRKEQHFFKPWAGFFRKMLFCFSHLFVQDENSKKLLEDKLGLTNVSCSGDTRVDRVLQIVRAAKKFPLIESFVQNKNVMVCGSTWEEDEKIIAQWYKEKGANWSLIIAPHDIQEKRLKEVEYLFKGKTIRYSEMVNNSSTSPSILIIDNIGILSTLYKYATIAYVGGGFGAGIHSILEPGAYGIPIFFGPRYKKFREAEHLVERGGAFVVSDLGVQITNVLQEANYVKCKSVVRAFMMKNEGATAEVMEYIKERL